MKKRTNWHELLREIVVNGADPKTFLKLFVGKCPKCGKVFDKPRTDQEYCGKGCRDADKQMEYRKRKNA